MRSLAYGVVTTLMFAGAACAQTSGPAALAEMNREYQAVWDELRPAVEAQLIQQATTELNAVHETWSGGEAFIKEVQGIRLGLGTAPGLQRLDRQALELRVPDAGTWWLEVEATVRVKQKLWFLRTTVDVPVRLRVHELSVVARAAFDTTDPDRPLVQSVAQPDLHYRVKVRSSNGFFNVVFWLLNPIGERLARKAVDDALSSMGPSLGQLQGLPGPVPGDGAAPLVDSGAATPFQAVVDNVDKKLRQYHLPHGTLLEVIMDTPQTDSYLQAYGPGGPGNIGAVVDTPDGGDSAIWTGHYLASQAFRYSVTGEAAALDNVRHAVAGFGKLLDINGGTGLLARVAGPESSLIGQWMIRHNAVDTRAVLNGQPWVARQGGNGISRDQYSGAFMGLMLAHDLVNDPQVKAECATRIRQMLDYIIREDWFIDEDRRPFDATPGSSFPTFWAGVATQRLNFLLMGERVAPGAYAVDLAQASPLSSTVWLGTWVSTFNLDSYYKFNLGHINNYGYFRLETDPGRWQDMARALGILRRYVGHHGNPHFDLVHASVVPSIRAAKHSGVREAVRQFLERNHREVGPAVVDLSNVQWVTLALPSLTLPGHSPAPATVTLPSEPLPIKLRHPEGNFLWQRTCFSPARPSGGNPRKETPGIDLVLPYWMGKYHGAF